MGAISTVKSRPINPAMQNGSRSYASGLNQKLVQNCSHFSELHSEMVEYAGESEVYTKSLKQTLQEHYKEYAFLAETEGFMTSWWNMKNGTQKRKLASIEDEAKRIVVAAAKKKNGLKCVTAYGEEKVIKIQRRLSLKN